MDERSGVGNEGPMQQDNPIVSAQDQSSVGEQTNASFPAEEPLISASSGVPQAQGEQVSQNPPDSNVAGNYNFNSPAQPQSSQPETEGIPVIHEKPVVFTSGGLGVMFSRNPIFKILAGFGIFVIFATIVLTIIYFIQKNSNEKITLTYWGLWEDPAVMNTIISDFERQNPNIIINYTKEDPKQYTQRLLTRIQLGSGPDIFRYHNTWVPMLSKALLPLPNEVIARDDFIKQYYPAAATDLIRNGALYGIPLEIDSLSLFVNNSIFQAGGVKAPTTWEQFVSTSRALTVKDTNGKIKTAGAALGGFDNITHAPDIVSLFLIQNGADVRNLGRSTQNGIDALNFYENFMLDPQNSVWDSTLDPSITAFSKGNLAMFFGYSWDVFTLKSQNPNLNFSIYPVPHLPGRNYTVASYWVEGASMKSKHQNEVFKFMKFLTQKDTLEKLYTEESKVRQFGEPYPRVDMAGELNGNPLAAPFVSQAQGAQSTIFVGETYDDVGINAQLNGYLGNAIRSGVNGTSTATALDTLSKGVTQVLGQYGGQ